jgi:hypothetical protein
VDFSRINQQVQSNDGLIALALSKPPHQVDQVRALHP